jgi:hypothetical protein
MQRLMVKVRGDEPDRFSKKSMRDAAITATTTSGRGAHELAGLKSRCDRKDIIPSSPGKISIFRAFFRESHFCRVVQTGFR